MSENVIDDVIAAFWQYVRAFETLDPERVLPFYDEPCMFISMQGSFPLPTHADVKHFFERVMTDLRQQGYATSEFPQLGGKPLSESLALVSGVGIWRKADGEELRRFGSTYLMRRTNHAWRIAVAAVHDPSD